MKIAIIGHGRMGKLVEEVALKRGHKISCVIDVNDTHLFESKEFRESDVAIEFTTPATAVEGILSCFAAGVPVVVGTTGWNDSIPAIQDMCKQGKGTVFFSSNFSIGMNLFMSLNRYLAAMMNHFDNYNPRLTEVHHVHKLDHPSGTAVTLAGELCNIVERLSGWLEKGLGEKSDNWVLPVYHRREGEVPGIHTIEWESECDIISMTHEAKNRMGFAQGAVTAAEWLKGREKGFYTMADMLSEATGINNLI